MPETSALALASGITEDNVRTYLPDVQVFLVGTGIESAFGVLDATKVKRLADIIHTWPTNIAPIAKPVIVE
jgi:phosphoribosylanthranilate isomerase